MDGTSPDKNTLLLTLNQSHVIATVKTLSRAIKQPVFSDSQLRKLLRSQNGGHDCHKNRYFLRGPQVSMGIIKGQF